MEECLVWLPAIYGRHDYPGTWNSVHMFIECGLLHQRQQGNNRYTSASEAETPEASADSCSPIVSKGFKLIGIKNFSCFSIDDLEELLDKAANIVICLKNNFLNTLNYVMPFLD